MPEEFARELRVGSRLKRLLNELLQFQVKDPRLSGVRISEVAMSGDLGVAKVFFTLLDPGEDVNDAMKALDSAGGFLRARSGQALGLRRVPELRFLFDESSRRGMEIDRLIDDSLEKDAAGARVDPPDEDSGTH